MSVRKLPSGRYQVRVMIDGRRTTLGTYDTKRLAQQAEREALTDRDRQNFVAPTRATFAEVAEEWLGSRPGKVRESTRQGSDRYALGLALPVLGPMPVQRITSATLERLYSKLASDPSGRRTGRPLSASTIKGVHSKVRMVLESARRSRLIVHNPADDVTPPRGRRHEQTVWTAEETRAFLAAVAGDRMAIAYRLAAHTGMRRGEIAALRWTDVDLETGTITVRRTRGRVPGVGIVEDAPKTEKSRRTIAIDRVMVQALREWRQQLRHEEVRALSWNPGGYVVCWDNGEPPDPHHLTQRLSKLISTAGVPRIRFHDLRHTHATLGLGAGEDVRVMQERLGHSSAAITMDVYQHVTPEMDRATAERIGGMLG